MKAKLPPTRRVMLYFVNPIFAVLSLMLIFFLTAVSWVLLNAEFLAFTLILVYVGAVIVLFLFVVMMLEQQRPNIINIKKNYEPKYLLLTALPITIGLVAIFIFIVEDYSLLVPMVINDNNLYLLAQTLFTDYLLQFSITGLILLIAIIAAICLVGRGSLGEV